MYGEPLSDPGGYALPRHGDVLIDPALIDQRVVDAATRRPDSIAASFGDGSLTYEALVGQARGLAETIRARGIASGDVVGVCLGRSADFLVSALAVLMTGAAYLPLDPGYPDERLAFMVHDSATRLVVADVEQVPRFVGTEVVGPRPASAAAAETPAAPSGGAAQPRPRSASDVAYVIYTSGSTGTPKGVAVTHASLLNLVRWHQQAFAITAADRGTQVASPSFDAAVWEIWPYLAAGASLHIPDDATRTDPAALRDWLVERQISVSFLPTPLAEAVLALEWPPCPLRFLLTGGDTLHRRPRAGLPFRLVNNYGVTEAAVVSTSGIVPVDDESPDALLAGALPSTVLRSTVLPSIGWPIDGVAVHVVDDAFHKVADGEVGQLVIGGVSVAQGYLHRADLTEESFRPDPFGHDPTARVYLTGDRARRLPSGEIEFCGRSDEQVKIRGFRVELGEIEASLARHPAVRASAVVAVGAVGAVSAERRLVAYVVPDPGRPGGTSELRAYLAQRLPGYMLPGAFHELDALPLTPNGKLDRVALTATAAAEAAPAAADAPGTSEVEETRTELEEAVAGVIADVLGVEHVGLNQNFFLLGGHSMLGAQLVQRIGERFGLEVSLRTVFSHPTAAAMASEVERLLLEEIEALTDEESNRLADGLAGDPP